MAESKFATAVGHDETNNHNIGNDNINSNAQYGNNGNGYQGGGGPMARFITPGGHPMDTSQPAFPVFHRKFANPAPLGLMSFAATTFLLSLFNVRARGITTPNVILGMALGYGGLAQIIAGIEEWACGNTFGATAFTSYGGFWLSFAVLYIPQFEVVAAYGTEIKELDSALGLYLITWGIVTFIFLLACLKSSVALVSVFFFLTITFFLLAAGFLAGSVTATKAGGGFGLVTAACASYTALAGLLTKDTSHFLLPVGDLSRAK
ncbi:hypothetical protein CI109_105568 [Kwoniella shandongensis]|uniref:Uncharacterized protein n=1 Tax=Kwoniella shandongensis TaxID=1734106 RepID=A0A5M6C6I2_9TREE|nr:uncharacterized protein CI109_002285 [Kwoniella shandongensis]KAA5529392.1 hypothetical protein CI109_002285 [Kwoniella shandongensis]